MRLFGKTSTCCFLYGVSYKRVVTVWYFCRGLLLVGPSIGIPELQLRVPLNRMATNLEIRESQGKRKMTKNVRERLGNLVDKSKIREFFFQT